MDRLTFNSKRRSLTRNMSLYPQPSCIHLCSFQVFDFDQDIEAHRSLSCLLSLPRNAVGSERDRQYTASYGDNLFHRPSLNLAVFGFYTRDCHCLVCSGYIACVTWQVFRQSCRSNVSKTSSYWSMDRLLCKRKW